MVVVMRKTSGKRAILIAIFVFLILSLLFAALPVIDQAIRNG